MNSTAAAAAAADTTTTPAVRLPFDCIHVPSADLQAILCREHLAGASLCGLLILAQNWARFDTKRRKHLLTSIRNGQWLEGRDFEMESREELGGVSECRYHNPERGSSHYVRAWLWTPDGFDEPVVAAECHDDECESHSLVKWCRHCEHRCRVQESGARIYQQCGPSIAPQEFVRLLRMYVSLPRTTPIALVETAAAERLSRDTRPEVRRGGGSGGEPVAAGAGAVAAAASYKDRGYGAGEFERRRALDYD